MKDPLPLFEKSRVAVPVAGFFFLYHRYNYAGFPQLMSILEPLHTVHFRVEDLS